MRSLAAAVPAPPAGAGYRRDRFFQAGLAAWILSLLPSVAPVLPADLTFLWADQYADVPVLAFVVTGALLLVRRAQRRRERTFWIFLAVGILGWLAVRGLYLIIPYEDRGIGFNFATDSSYLTGYLFMALALEQRPNRDRETGAAAWGRRLESVGALVFGFTLLSYFTLAPSVFNPRVYESWVSSLFLYAAFDAYLVVRCLVLLRSGNVPGWRRPLQALTAAFAFWLLCDLTEGLMYLGTLPPIDSGGPADLLWGLPSLALLVAVRVRTWTD